MQNEEVTSDAEIDGDAFALINFVRRNNIRPIILWAVQKDKSKFVRYHSLQAIFFHIAYMAVIFVVVFLIVIVAIGFGIGFGSMSRGHHGSDGAFPAIMMIMMFAFYAVFFISIIAAVAYEVYIAIKAYQGSYIKIPVIGKIIYKKVYGE